MRADPADYEMVAPGNLPDVLSLLAAEPTQWLPIAGGTDVMVVYAAGKLAPRKLVSLWNLPELRHIETSGTELTIGACCTYTDLREHTVVAREFPLLASAASWTGSIANQNRGTLGGNIVNASPAADSLPALLVYEAELILISARGERRVPYVNFHTGYKQTLLAPDELIRAIRLPRGYSQHLAYSRKVGARNAQAISKVCMAALGKLENGVIVDVRIAAGSVAPIPIRLGETERALHGKRLDPAAIELARKIAMSEVRPIDDIRSTAAYRTAVLGNLAAEFLHALRGHEKERAAFAHWNQLAVPEAEKEILPCCGSVAWARELAARRPFYNGSSLIAASDEIWNSLDFRHWQEAFSKHPRIGERKAPACASQQSASWSAQEQGGVSADDAVRSQLATANREYEARFGRVFIVCATGKSSAEILDILRRRLQNDEGTELREAGEEQRRITNIRLRKWLAQ